MDEITLFSKFIEKVQAYPMKQYRNQPSLNRRQASVVIIFRLNPKNFNNNECKLMTQIQDSYKIFSASDWLKYVQNCKNNLKSTDNLIQMLYAKRAVYEKDPHSGEIAFPGGKCDDDESDDLAAIREVNEEIGIDLNDKSHFAYLGKFPKNYFTYPTTKGNLFVSVHLYMQISLDELKFTLNKSEISECFWINLSFFLNPDLTKMKKKEISAPKNWGTSVKMSWMLKKSVGSLFSGLIGSRHFGFDITEHEFLYGLTFYFTIYMIRIMNKIIITELPKQKLLPYKNLRYMVDVALTPELIYEEKVGWIKKKIANYGYYVKRQKQFENIVDIPMSRTLLLILLIGFYMFFHKYFYVPYISKL